MKSSPLKKTFIAASLLAAAGYVGHVSAHTAGTVLDSGGNNESATDMAQILCYDDGNGAPHHLYADVQDNSPQQYGLLVSVQLLANNQMTNATDTVSGDISPSQGISLAAGQGPYTISISKTAAGPRNFTVTYHCMTAGGTHTGTDITVFQVQ